MVLAHVGAIEQFADCLAAQGMPTDVFGLVASMRCVLERGEPGETRRIRCRTERAAQAVELGFQLATLVHPTACVADGVPVGSGTVIKATAVVEPGASVGAIVILGALSYVGHDVVVEDAAHISSGGKVAGSSVIAREAWIGLGATVKDGVRVGEGAQIGAGAVVLGDIPAGVVATGNPAEPRWRSGLFDLGGP